MQPVFYNPGLPVSKHITGLEIPLKIMINAAASGGKPQRRLFKKYIVSLFSPALLFYLLGKEREEGSGIGDDPDSLRRTAVHQFCH